MSTQVHEWMLERYERTETDEDPITICVQDAGHLERELSEYSQLSATMHVLGHASKGFILFGLGGEYGTAKWSSGSGSSNAAQALPPNITAAAPIEFDYLWESMLYTPDELLVSADVRAIVRHFFLSGKLLKGFVWKQYPANLYLSMPLDE